MCKEKESDKTLQCSHATPILAMYESNVLLYYQHKFVHYTQY